MGTIDSIQFDHFIILSIEVQYRHTHTQRMHEVNGHSFYYQF